MAKFELNLQNTEVAFADKSNIELQKKRWLFKMMSSQALTDFGSKLTNFAFSMHLPIQWAIKATVFKQFCGGETIEECETAISKLGESKIGTILDYSVEGRFEEEDFGETKEEILRTIVRAKSDDRIPFAVFKITGIAPLGTLEKVSSGVKLTEKGEWKWERIESRVDDICKFAHSIGQPIFIDAEESWIQNAIDKLATGEMEKYNLETPIIYNTIQLYRHDRLEYLKNAHQEAKKAGYFLAVKLVRGAYMEKERERAEKLNYPSPIQSDKESTDRDFNEALRYCVENIEDIAFVSGTHNEESVQLLARLLDENNIPANHPHVNFSQLFGMSDNLSYVLAKNNYNVSKYVPYGPVKDTLPYLIRRAKENTSVIGQVCRELEMIEEETKRRKMA